MSETESGVEVDAILSRLEMHSRAQAPSKLHATGYHTTGGMTAIVHSEVVKVQQEIARLRARLPAPAGDAPPVTTDVEHHPV